MAAEACIVLHNVALTSKGFVRHRLTAVTSRLFAVLALLPWLIISVQRESAHFHRLLFTHTLRVHNSAATTTKKHFPILLLKAFKGQIHSKGLLVSMTPEKGCLLFWNE